MKDGYQRRNEVFVAESLESKQKNLQAYLNNPYSSPFTLQNSFQITFFEI